jgi:hypothetical protein
VVSIDRLVDVIWPAGPPKTARAAVHTYVKTLRQALAHSGAPSVILTCAPGYLAQVPDGSLDVALFQRHAAAARSASPQVAADRLAAALALWRGPALGGLGDGVLAAEAAQLDQMRLTATEERITADLALGRQDALVAELAGLVGRYPANERLRAQLSAAVARVLGGWLTVVDAITADSPSEEIGWHRPPVPKHPVSAATTALAVANPQVWFENEQPALVAGLERAASLGLHGLVCHFASARPGPSFLGANRFESRERINTAARAAGDLGGEAMMLAEFGQLRHMQDRLVEACRHFAAALDGFRELGDVTGQAVALAGLGATCREPGRLVAALHFLDQASALLDGTGDDADVATCAA